MDLSRKQSLQNIIKIKMFSKLALRPVTSQKENKTKVSSELLQTACTFTWPVRPDFKDEESEFESENGGLKKCPFCHQLFRRLGRHLAKHKDQNDQLESNTYICKVCNKIFGNSSAFYQHMRTHQGYRRHVCQLCGKGFTQSTNLNNHMRVHTGEKPFKCSHCGKAFAQLGNLKSHFRLHTNERPFKCHFCDKAFIQSGTLSSHMKSRH